MPHRTVIPARPAAPGPVRPTLWAWIGRRAGAVLLTAAAAVTAAATGLTTAHGLAFGGFGPAAARVAGEAEGTVDARPAGAGHDGRSGTFGRPSGRGGRRDARDAGSGLGRVDVVGGNRRAAAASVRQQLLLGEAGTYIGELLRRRDSSLIRWPDRASRPLAVFVGSGAGLADWRPEYVGAVASALGAGARAGVPLAFQLVGDSARADVHVSWIDRFAEPISGRTVWARDDRWWMVDGSITLALHHSDGAPLDGDQMRAITMHEVGHLIGLDHTAGPDNVMAPRVRVRELSAADGATARLLYSVPAGRVR